MFRVPNLAQLWPLAGFIAGGPWFNSSAALVHSQLVYLLPAPGILNLLTLLNFELTGFLDVISDESLESSLILKLNAKMALINLLLLNWLLFALVGDLLIYQL